MFGRVSLLPTPDRKKNTFNDEFTVSNEFMPRGPRPQLSYW